MAILYDVVLTYRCNWNCVYCSNAKSGNRTAAETEMPIEVLRATMRYISYVVRTMRLKHPDEQHTIVLFGGEPMLRMDAVDFVVKTASTIGGVDVNIITNTSLIPKYKDELLAYRDMLEESGGRLNIAASYDYVLQDEYRKAGTYDTVRDNIRWLYHNGLLLKTVSTFTNSSLYRFPDVIDDIAELEKELPGFRSSFNIDRCNNESAELDIEKTQQAFSAASLRMSKLLSKENIMISNNRVCGNKAPRNDNCVSGSVYMGVDIDGSVYPAYDVVFCNDVCKKHCYIGSVFDPFAELFLKHKEAVARLGVSPSEKCSKCTLPCRFYPWTAITDDVAAYGQIPSEETLCPTNEIIGGVLKNYV